MDTTNAEAGGFNRGTRFIYNAREYLSQLREARGAAAGQVAAQMAFDPWGGARIRGLALLRLRFDPTRRRYGRLT